MFVQLLLLFVRALLPFISLSPAILLLDQSLLAIHQKCRYCCRFSFWHRGPMRSMHKSSNGTVSSSLMGRCTYLLKAQPASLAGWTLKANIMYHELQVL